MPTPGDFERVNLSGPSDPGSYKQRQSEAQTGEFGYDVHTAEELPQFGNDLVPTPARPDLQFSSNKSDTPQAMALETDESQNAFAELQQFLNNNLETAGSRVCNDQRKPYRPRHGAEGE